MTTFTRADWTRLAVAKDEMEAFRAFVLDRFGAYTRETEVTTGGGMRIAPVNDPHAATDAGWGRWHVNPFNLFNPAAEAFNVDHFLDNESGRTIQTATVAVPLAFVFAQPTVEQEQYERYVALKAKFEPGVDPAPNPQAAEPVAPGAETLDVAGLPAAHRTVLRECVAEAWRNHEQNDATETDGVAFDIARRLEDVYL